MMQATITMNKVREKSTGDIWYAGNGAVIDNEGNKMALYHRSSGEISYVCKLDTFWNRFEVVE